MNTSIVRPALLSLVSLAATGSTVSNSSTVQQNGTSYLTRTVNGSPVHWPRDEIVLTPIAPVRGIAAEDLREALLFGARTWNRALSGCRVPRLRIAALVASNTSSREDGVNSVTWRSVSWCPDNARDRADCYDSSKTALTRLYLSHEHERRVRGELREADIEFNGVDFAWSLNPKQPEELDLRAVVLHELGHILGLDHQCSTDTEPLAPGMRRSEAQPCSSWSSGPSVMQPWFTERVTARSMAPSSGDVATLCRSLGSFTRAEGT